MEYANTLIGRVKSALTITGSGDPKRMNVLSLAYVGDTVWDLYVRTMLATNSDCNSHGLHVMAAQLVCARAQAEAFRRIEGLLTEDEMYVFKRGRNSHMGTVPKNAAITDYRSATGLEALIGFLYLSGQDERLTCLVHAALDVKKEEA